MQVNPLLFAAAALFVSAAGASLAPLLRLLVLEFALLDVAERLADNAPTSGIAT